MSDESRTGRRFEISLPIEIRGEVDGQPFQGVTDNVSAAGVYIRGDAAFPVGSQVRFSMTLPGSTIGAGQDIEVECEGRVVRIEETEDAAHHDRKGVACLIDEYRFIRPGGGSSGGSKC